MADFDVVRNENRSRFNQVRNESQKNGSTNNNRSASFSGEPFRENLTEMEKKRRREEKRNNERSLFPAELAIDPRLIALRERIPNGR